MKKKRSNRVVPREKPMHFWNITRLIWSTFSLGIFSGEADDTQVRVRQSPQVKQDLFLEWSPFYKYVVGVYGTPTSDTGGVIDTVGAQQFTTAWLQTVRDELQVGTIFVSSIRLSDLIQLVNSDKCGPSGEDRTICIMYTPPFVYTMSDSAQDFLAFFLSLCWAQGLNPVLRIGEENSYNSAQWKFPTSPFDSANLLIFYAGTKYNFSFAYNFYFYWDKTDESMWNENGGQAPLTTFYIQLHYGPEATRLVTSTSYAVSSNGQIVLPSGVEYSINLQLQYSNRVQYILFDAQQQLQYLYPWVLEPWLVYSSSRGWVNNTVGFSAYVRYNDPSSSCPYYGQNSKAPTCVFPVLSNGYSAFQLFESSLQSPSLNLQPADIGPAVWTVRDPVTLGNANSGEYQTMKSFITAYLL